MSYSIMRRGTIVSTYYTRKYDQKSGGTGLEISIHNIKAKA